MATAAQSVGTRTKAQWMLDAVLTVTFSYVVLITPTSFALQNVPKPGHKRTDSTHSSNESEYTFSSEIAETEDIPSRTEVHFR